MASIKCGNCTGTHESVSEVRACYGQVTVAAATKASPVVDQATEKQRSFIDRLREERGLDPLLFTGTKTQASAEITRLLGMPKKVSEKKPESLPEVPEGRYAVEDEGVLKFFLVQHGKPGGKWEGSTFLKVMASDEKHLVRGKEQKARVLKAIAANPAEASYRFGRELGQCGICGRTLTDEASRAAGIGPICASKAGW